MWYRGAHVGLPVSKHNTGGGLGRTYPRSPTLHPPLNTPPPPTCPLPPTHIYPLPPSPPAHNPPALTHSTHPHTFHPPSHIPPTLTLSTRPHTFHPPSHIPPTVRHSTRPHSFHPPSHIPPTLTHSTRPHTFHPPSPPLTHSTRPHTFHSPCCEASSACSLSPPPRCSRYVCAKRRTYLCELEAGLRGCCCCWRWWPRPKGIALALLRLRPLPPPGRGDDSSLQPDGGFPATAAARSWSTRGLRAHPTWPWRQLGLGLGDVRRAGSAGTGSRAESAAVAVAVAEAGVTWPSMGCEPRAAAKAIGPLFTGEAGGSRRGVCPCAAVAGLSGGRGGVFPGGSSRPPSPLSSRPAPTPLWPLLLLHADPGGRGWPPVTATPPTTPRSLVLALATAAAAAAAG